MEQEFPGPFFRPWKRKKVTWTVLLFGHVSSPHHRLPPTTFHTPQQSLFLTTALWARVNKNPDCSTGSFARLFTRSLAPLTHSLALHWSLCLRAHLAYSRVHGKVNDYYGYFFLCFFSVLDHSAPLVWHLTFTRESRLAAWLMSSIKEHQSEILGWTEIEARRRMRRMRRKRRKRRKRKTMEKRRKRRK